MVRPRHAQALKDPQDGVGTWVALRAAGPKLVCGSLCKFGRIARGYSVQYWIVRYFLGVPSLEMIWGL